MKLPAFTVSAVALLVLTTTTTAFAPIGHPKHAASLTELYSGVERNANFAKLAGGYLFPEIGRRRNAYLEKNPEMASKIISLGIGDTTRPIPPHILNGLLQGVTKLGVKETYTGAPS